MRITPDTNVLVRAVVRDDVKQAKAAAKLPKKAAMCLLNSLCPTPMRN